MNRRSSVDASGPVRCQTIGLRIPCPECEVILLDGVSATLEEIREVFSAHVDRCGRDGAA